MTKTKLTLTYLSPSLVAIGLQLINILVSRHIHNSYYAVNSNCGPAPSSTLTVSLALAGLAISIFGMAHAFKLHHKWLGLVAAIITLVVGFGGFIALFALSFEICI